MVDAEGLKSFGLEPQGLELWGAGLTWTSKVVEITGAGLK